MTQAREQGSKNTPLKMRAKMSGNIWCIVHFDNNGEDDGEIWELISETPYIAVCADNEQDAKKYFIEVFNELVALGEEGLAMPIREHIYLRLRYMIFCLTHFRCEKPSKSKKGFSKWHQGNISLVSPYL